MLYRTRYGEAAQRILSRFGPTEACIVALETLIMTAQRDVKAQGPEELAAKTCRGLHMDKPGRGVVCAKCFEAAMAGKTDRAVTGDEMARLRPRKLEVPAAPQAPGDEVTAPELAQPPEVDREDIERQVAEMLGAGVDGEARRGRR